MRTSVVVAALVAVGILLTACASILGLDPLDVYVAGDAATVDAIVADVVTGDGSDVTPSLDGGAPGEGGSIGEVEDAGCDPTEQPPTPAVYVSVAFDGGSPNGSSSAPYPTIGASLNRAKLDNAKAIIVEEGTYLENITLEAFGASAAMTIDGAWTRNGAVWTRDCSPGRQAKTVLKSTTDIGLRFANNQGVLGVANLTIEPRPSGTTAPDGAGASRYAVFVESSLVRLTSVHVKAPAADPGGVASDGTPGGSSCTTSSSCPAAPADGAAGVNGAPASGATFGAAGFTPRDGAPGVSNGSPGSNGAPGGGVQTRNDCSNGCNATCDPNSAVTRSSTAGSCGCGGSGGTTGKAGRGGGASVAVFATGAGTLVSIKFSELMAGAGGNGSAGGVGGAGGPPTNGAAGTTVDCFQVKCCEQGTCPGACGCYSGANWPQVCIDQGNAAPANNKLLGGVAGGAGRPGGRGGNGGGGAGGASYAFVAVGGAEVSVEGSKRTFEAGGSGAGGAPGGLTGEHP